MKNSQKIGLYTAMAVVIANMIGTGVFTSLGFQVVEIQSVFVLMLLWITGGVLAFCGAVSYAELGAVMPRSGGEYHFLSKIYHPALGFVGGWISATVGFAAPVALAAITFGKYLQGVFPGWNAEVLAIIVLIAVTYAHLHTVKNSGRFQRLFTAIKLLLVFAFIAGTFLFTPEPQNLSLFPEVGDGKLLLGSAFAVSLIYVSYAYTGWNAATYLINEMENPQKHLPIALGGGTLIVMTLYVLLNYSFLYAAPMDALANEVEVGFIAATFAFNTGVAKFMGVVLALLLVSTVSSMVFAGPRVIQVMGQDYPAFKAMSKTNAHGVPVRAILIQSTISLLFIITSSFDKILVFAGFTLGCTTFLAVLSLLVHRWKHKDIERPYKAWGYPLSPIIYLVLMGWTLTYLLIEQTQESVAGLALGGIGLLLYYFGNREKADT
ncbi:MAG: amino acid permease [Bacteroidia bacterium]|nr:amino acid permease [Bacteroidia bacterium]